MEVEESRFHSFELRHGDGTAERIRLGADVLSFLRVLEDLAAVAGALDEVISLESELTAEQLHWVEEYLMWQLARDDQTSGEGLLAFRVARREFHHWEELRRYGRLRSALPPDFLEREPHQIFVACRELHRLGLHTDLHCLFVRLAFEQLDRERPPLFALPAHADKKGGFLVDPRHRWSAARRDYELEQLGEAARDMALACTGTDLLTRASDQYLNPISAAAHYTLVRRGDGTLWVTGSGRVIAALLQTEGRVRVGQLAQVRRFSPGDVVLAAAAGPRHCLVLLQSGECWAFGDNSHGQLGSADGQLRERLLASDAVAIETGDDCSFWITHQAVLMGCGAPVDWLGAQPRAIDEQALEVTQDMDGVVYTRCLDGSIRAYVPHQRLVPRITDTRISHMDARAGGGVLMRGEENGVAFAAEWDGEEEQVRVLGPLQHGGGLWCAAAGARTGAVTDPASSTSAVRIDGPAEQGLPLYLQRPGGLVMCALGPATAFIIAGNGRLWAMGENTHGQLGMGEIEASETFRSTHFDTLYRVTDNSRAGEEQAQEEESHTPKKQRTGGKLCLSCRKPAEQSHESRESLLFCGGECAQRYAQFY